MPTGPDSSLTVGGLLVVGVLQGAVQLLRPAHQAPPLQQLRGGAVLLAAVLRHHLPLDVLQLLVREVLHEHRLEHLQRAPLDTPPPGGRGGAERHAYLLLLLHVGQEVLREGLQALLQLPGVCGGQRSEVSGCPRVRIVKPSEENEENKGLACPAALRRRPCLRADTPAAPAEDQKKEKVKTTEIHTEQNLRWV
ncbi:hypothetical protein EYF80_046935 [Liparis tanakae]|uniref:Uncharacterized protein n=1 Tax=Liparis tanakae TaxID=230148 RepID=A0A4Z2FQ69_9TELE|nr:hypothetical protein EYF80_046935 [Liparis tanakae]